MRNFDHSILIQFRLILFFQKRNHNFFHLMLQTKLTVEDNIYVTSLIDDPTIERRASPKVRVLKKKVIDKNREREVNCEIHKRITEAG